MGPHLLACSDPANSEAGQAARDASSWHCCIPLEGGGSREVGAGSEEPVSNVERMPSLKPEVGGKMSRCPDYAIGLMWETRGRLGCSVALSLFFPQFDDFSRDLCVQALLDIMDMFCDRLR